MSRKLWVIAAVSAVAGASAPTTAVADDASVTAPTITTWRGPTTVEALPSEVLTCDAGAIPGAAFSWQLDGIDIPGATAQTYTPGKTALHHMITCTVTTPSPEGPRAARSQSVLIFLPVGDPSPPTDAASKPVNPQPPVGPGQTEVMPSRQSLTSVLEASADPDRRASGLPFSTPTDGVLTVRWKLHTLTVGRASRHFSGGEGGYLTFRPTRAGQRLLKRRRHLSVLATATFRSTDGSVTTTRRRVRLAR